MKRNPSWSEDELKMGYQCLLQDSVHKSPQIVSRNHQVGEDYRSLTRWAILEDMQFGPFR